MKPRLLANQNSPAPSVQHLRDRGHDVASVAEGGGGLSDSEVLARGVAEQRWIITFDRDYGNLIYARGLVAPPAVILFRLRSYRPKIVWCSPRAWGYISGHDGRSAREAR